MNVGSGQPEMFRVEATADSITLHIRAGQDEDTLPDLKELMHRSFSIGAQRLVVDLRECPYLTSQIVSEFVKMWRKHPDIFEVHTAPNGTVYDNLEVCGFFSRNTFFKVVPPQESEILKIA
jgi:anti-anti-sigma regulatory factor